MLRGHVKGLLFPEAARLVFATLRSPLHAVKKTKSCNRRFQVQRGGTP